MKTRKVYEHVRLEVEDQVAQIILSRPPLNVLTIPMMNQIAEAAMQMDHYPEVKALVFRSDQRVFSAGVDIADHTADRVFDMLDAFGAILDALSRLSIPTVAVIRGQAVGGGFELAMACDFPIAALDARFGQPEIKLGVFAPYATVLLPRLVGTRKAAEMLLLGEPIEAPEAARIGLLYRAVAGDQLDAEVATLLTRLCTLSAPVLRVAVRALRLTGGMTLADAVDRSEAIYLNELMELEDPEEGLHAFLEKRKPEWKNR